MHSATELLLHTFGHREGWTQLEGTLFALSGSWLAGQWRRVFQVMGVRPRLRDQNCNVVIVGPWSEPYAK